VNRYARVAVAVLAVAGGLAVAPTAPAVAAPPDVVTRYAPFVYLAPGEGFTPMSAGSFVGQSSLSWAHDGGCPDHQAAARTQVNASQLGSGGYQHRIADALCTDHGAMHRSDELTRPRQGGKPGVPDGEGFFLNFPNELRGGQGTQATVYYEYSPRNHVTYWFFYPFNDAPAPVNLFDHEGDWERISVRLDGQDNAVTVAYFEHAGYCTRPWGEAGKHEGHPLAYSARGTHATYPRAGTFPIAGGLATDTTGRGDGWATYGNLADARAEGWYGFGGAWGEVGAGSDSTGPVGPSRFKSPAPGDWSRPCS
jgi:hypothetical protein